MPCGSGHELIVRIINILGKRGQGSSGLGRGPKRDELRGEIVKAYVVLAPGVEASEMLETEIQDFVKGHTAPYKYPREIEFRKALPKTISGKIRRVDLRAEANKN